ALALLESAGPSLFELHPAAAAHHAMLLHQLGRDEEAARACRDAQARLAGASDHAPPSGAGDHAPPSGASDMSPARLLNIHGAVLQRLGRRQEARAELETGSALAERAGNPTGRAAIETNLARLDQDCGALETALGRFERALEVAALYGDRLQEANAALNVVET